MVGPCGKRICFLNVSYYFENTEPRNIDNFVHIQYITYILTMEGKKMARKTVEERIAAIDTKIATKKAEIEEL